MQLILIIIVVAIVLFILFKVAKVLIKIAAVFAILLLAFFTNPTVERHWASAKIRADQESQTLRRKDVTVKDYKIVSLTQHQEKIVGIGAFTKVWIFRL